MFSSLSLEDKYAYLVKCSNAYYETGNSIISDSQFDQYVSEYEKESKKTFKYLGKSNNKKCILPVWMGSLDKVKTSDRLTNFLSKYVKDSIIYSEKLDGCSMLYYSDTNKNSIRLATRGDGTYGSDVTHLLPYIKCPKIKNETIIIRGEIIMKKDIFNKYYSDRCPNARNFVSGLINSKTLDTEALQRCSFVAYCIPSIKYNPLQTFLELSKLGFDVPIYGKIDKKSCTIDYLSSLLDTTRNNSNYEMDGLVLSDNLYHSEKEKEDPKYTIAFKKNNEGVPATVVDVLWEETRYGLLKPRVQVKPVTYGGVVMTYFSGYNAKYIVDNKIGPGTILNVCRSGDVIPDILGVIQSTQAKLPSIEYEWTESVDIRVKEKSINSAQQIAYFFTICGAKGLKEATIQKCIDIGLNTVELILNSTIQQLLKADGIKDKTAEKILEQLTIVKLNCTLPNILTGTCIFEGFGEKKLQKCIEALPDIYPIIFKNKSFTSSDESNWEILLNNVGIKTQASTFITQFKLFLKSEWKLFCNKFCIKKEPQNNIVNNNVDSSKKCNFIIVFTDIRDNEFKLKLESLGATVSDSVTKNTTHLIVKDKNALTTKMKKAKEYNVPFYTLDEMKKLVATLN